MTTPFTVPKPVSDKPRLLPTADMHAARVCMLADLGTHDKEYQGEKKKRRQVRLGFELDEWASFKEGEPAEPFLAALTLTLSMDKKSTFRKYVEAIRGTLTDAEAAAFDCTSLIGAPALVQIEHKPKQDGTGTYAKIVNVAKLPKAMEGQLKPAYIEPLVYHTSMGRGGTFEKLPQFLQTEVLASEELKNQPY